MRPPGARPGTSGDIDAPLAAVAMNRRRAAQLLQGRSGVLGGAVD